MISEHIVRNEATMAPNVAPPRGGPVLSSREREIVAMAARGATDKEIADGLCIAVATLRTYWVRVREKLGAVNRTHAIALATVGAPAAGAGDARSRLADSLARDRVATWVWQGRLRQAHLDTVAERLFCLPASDFPLPMERLLAHVWSPDRARFERFLAQGMDLRPMTPIELRVGLPGDYRHLIRTVNMASQAPPESTLLLASTTVHVFA